MLPKLQGSRFIKKYSVQFVNQHGKLSEPFYFFDNKPHDSSQTWQVLRSEFDQMMLDNAREHGVTVHEGAQVTEVSVSAPNFNGKRVCTGSKYSSAPTTRTSVLRLRSCVEVSTGLTGRAIGSTSLIGSNASY
jgi:hypothetical protein